MSNQDLHCLLCNRSEAEVVLIQMRYQGEKRWICPQHLPLLIHQPAQLASVLPGAEHFSLPEENGRPHEP